MRVNKPGRMPGEQGLRPRVGNGRTTTGLRTYRCDMICLLRRFKVSLPGAWHGVKHSKARSFSAATGYSVATHRSSFFLQPDSAFTTAGLLLGACGVRYAAVQHFSLRGRRWIPPPMTGFTGSPSTIRPRSGVVPPRRSTGSKPRNACWTTVGRPFTAGLSGENSTPAITRSTGTLKLAAARNPR